MKKILIIESNVDGHYGVYLAKILEYFIKKKFQIILATDDGKEVNDFLLHTLNKLDNFEKTVTVKRYSMLDRRSKNSPLQLIFWQIKYWKLFKKIFKENCHSVKIDHIFIPYLDRVMFSFALLGSPFKAVSFSGIVMRPTFHHIKMGVTRFTLNKYWIDLYKGLIFKKLLWNRHLKYIFSIDETLPTFFVIKQEINSSRICYFPDSVDEITLIDRDISRNYFRLSTSAKVLLIFGSLDVRKNIPEALEWVKKNNSIGLERFQLFIVGKLSDEVSEILSNSKIAEELSKSSDLVVINRYVSSYEEALVFSAVDLIWLKYLNFSQMSGLMVKAGTLDIPMHLPDYGVMGWYRKQLEKLESHAEFSIPKLKYGNKNPFKNHIWSHSLHVLDQLADKI